MTLTLQGTENTKKVIDISSVWSRALQALPLYTWNIN